MSSGESTPGAPDELGAMLARTRELAARRPVAARVVALAGDPATGARELAGALAADVALAAAVLRLANSAAHGLSGRVRTVPFAVTVVGFATVRAMAALAAAGADAAPDLPDDFWPRCKVTAAAAGALADAFALPAADASCLGLLAGLGQAVMHQHDGVGYAALLADVAGGGGGRAALAAAETARYGVRHTEVSAAALASWGFPGELTGALRAVDDEPGQGVPATAPGEPGAWTACLRTAVEVAGRLLDADHATSDLGVLSGAVVGEDEAGDVVEGVRRAVAEDW